MCSKTHSMLYGGEICAELWGLLGLAGAEMM